MSVLGLVRHGQASFFASDYDKLSVIGERQLSLLGKLWARQRMVVDEVYTGPRLRQRDSAKLVGVEFTNAGLPWPEPIVLPELDEYDLDGLANRFAPRLAGMNPEFARLVMSYQRSDGELNKMREFQRMFESLLHHWQADESAADDVESWMVFRERVAGVLRRIQGTPGTQSARRLLYFGRVYRMCDEPRTGGVARDRTRVELAGTQWLRDGICL